MGGWHRNLGRKLWLAGRYVRSRRASRELAPEVAGLECFCIFLGTQRSGHSLVGSLLDAHPDAVVAHEANALRYLKYGFDRLQLFSELIENSKRFASRGRTSEGYSYAVPNQWQGRHRELRVIGDKRGGGSIRRLLARPDLFERLQETVAVPVRWIHVVRNPFDTIATICRRSRRTLAESIDYWERHVDGVAEIRPRIASADLLELHHEELLADPTKHLTELAAFLGLAPEADWLRDCASILFERPQQTRDRVAWTEPDVHRVTRTIARHPFLRSYEGTVLAKLHSFPGGDAARGGAID